MRTSRTLTYGHLLTTTREKYHKAGILTNIFSESNPLLMTLKENSWKVQTKGGEMIRVNLMTSANTTGTAYTGYEDLNVATPRRDDDCILPLDSLLLGSLDEWP